MKYPIIDLHCDLLACVAENIQHFTFDSSETNCSIPQLRASHVQTQVLTLFTEYHKSEVDRQLALYPKLPRGEMHFPLAIENASGLIDEDEPLHHAFIRFETIESYAKLIYISLTWNEENRFGGGNNSTVGLKDDGRAFLDYMSGRGVAIDLSHTSDALAEGVLTYIDQNCLDVSVIASHSNYRAIKDVPRNLPDELALEVIRRKGVIGLNFVKKFIGEAPEDLLKHLHHALKLGGEDAICMGADFFGGLDLPSIKGSSFFEHLPNAGCYQEFLRWMEGEFSEEIIVKFTMKNAERFM